MPIDLGSGLVWWDALKRCTLQKILKCCAGFERKAAFSDTFKGTISRVYFASLLADAELPNDRLIALGIVSLEVVQ